jgi:small conductance mechanosensitive channel
VVVATQTDALDWVRIAVIVLGALVASRVVPRLVRRVVRRLLDSRMRRRLGAIRAHTPRALLDSAPVPAIRHAQRSEAFGAIFRHLSVIAIWLVAAVLVLHELDVALETVVTGAGFLGLAVAFGAQDLLRDAIAGFFLLVDDRYGVGDHVQIGELEGDVEQVSLRWTRLRDARGVEWYVPNGRVLELGNHSQRR